MLFSAAVLAFLASSALASPLEARSFCSQALAKFKVAVPTGQTQLVVPQEPLTGMVLGVGIQNYTCTAAGTYTSAGAVAELFDLSCVTKTPRILAGVPDLAYTIWKNAPSYITLKKVKSILNVVPISENVGQHYFIPTPVQTIVPMWDHTSSGLTSGNPQAFAVAKKVGNTPSPLGSSNAVDWLSLEVTSGKLATKIFRTETRGGVAPSSCTPGSPLLSVKYISFYAYFGGEVSYLV